MRLGLAVGVAALCGAMVACGGGETGRAAAPAAPPGLPEGRLKLLRTGLDESRYLGLDDRRQAGKAVEVTVLTVAKDPKGLTGGAALGVERKGVGCAPQRIFDAAAAQYDAAGKLVAQQVLAAGRYGRPANPDEQELITALCATPPDSGAQVFDGWRAAQRDFQVPPDGYSAVDAHGWAWLCADGARHGWRASLPGECDKAAALNPGSQQVRLDRGYMNLARGAFTNARPDFEAAVAAAPQDPRALFGRGLVRSGLGDEPGGKADRAAAIAVDPKILRWVEGTYRFTVGTGWRTG
ncbi:MAG: hypothetical protein ABW042_06960 [Phenylobacterium sp.]